MFSVQQKRDISDAVQKILRETAHPELPPTGEVSFTLHVDGAESWSFADIKNNGAVGDPGVNPHNELMVSMPEEKARELIEAAQSVPYMTDHDKPSTEDRLVWLERAVAQLLKPDPRATPDEFMKEMLSQQISKLSNRIQRLEDRDKINRTLYSELRFGLDKLQEFLTPIIEDQLIADHNNKIITLREDNKSLHTRLNNLETAIRQLGNAKVNKTLGDA